ncbi:MAG: hypothetical protein RR838_08465 [Clostridium sp.]
MKKGYIYIESLVAGFVTAIMVISISKIFIASNSDIEVANEFSKGANIVRSISSIYRDGNDILIGENGLYVSTSDEVYNYVLKGVKPKDGEYILYCRNAYEEGIKHLKVSLVFKDGRNKTINEVIGK